MQIKTINFINIELYIWFLLLMRKQTNVEKYIQYFCRDFLRD